MDLQATTRCLVCNESAYTYSDAHSSALLTSQLCGHQCCRKCLYRHNGKTLSIAAPKKQDAGLLSGAASATYETYQCPVCNRGCFDWVDHEGEENSFEKEKLIRQKVLAVYHKTRENFAETPAYNDFLEQREDIIYELAFGNDEQKKKGFYEELETYEAEHQMEIVEAKQKKEAEMKNRVREIVEKEGTFYEMLRQGFKDGFFPASKKGELVHPFKQLYAEFFMSPSYGKFDSAAQRHLLANSSFGKGNHPKPLNPNARYNTQEKKPLADRNLLFRAGGHFRETMRRRVMLELWGGLRAGVRQER